MFIQKSFSRSLSDLFTEFVDHVRAAVWIGTPHPHMDEPILQRMEKSQTQTVEIVATLCPNAPEAWFIKLVEDCLRKYPDSITLGESPLVGYVGVQGESQVTRGRQLQQLLHDAIESLRPTENRPMGAFPRAWFNYVVLHDAYVVGLRNRDVMARLYISEGTFNRTRRNAVRGVAMWLIEGKRQRSMKN